MKKYLGVEEGSLTHSSWVTFYIVVAILALIYDILWCVALMYGETEKAVLYMISAFFILIILPVFILDFAGFITSIFSKDSRRRLLMGLSASGIGLLILTGILLLKGGVDVEKLEKNYHIHSSEMEQAIDYTLSCLEDGCGINIEFEGNGRVGLFQIYKNGIWDGSWYLSTKEVDSLAAVIGFRQENLDEIQRRLYKAECHSISIIKQDGTYDVATLMFRRDLDVAYYYDIHKVAMTETEMEKINADDCTMIAFNPRVCFVFGSPAYGDIAFPGKQEYLERRRGKP